jgi:hypothetical protein
MLHSHKHTGRRLIADHSPRVVSPILLGVLIWRKHFANTFSVVLQMVSQLVRRSTAAFFDFLLCSLWVPDEERITRKLLEARPSKLKRRFLSY